MIINWLETKIIQEWKSPGLLLLGHGPVVGHMEKVHRLLFLGCHPAGTASPCMVRHISWLEFFCFMLYFPAGQIH